MDMVEAQRAQARAAVRVACAVISDTTLKTTDNVVEALERLHYDVLTAERLTLLVPLAFGRVALKARGIEHYAWTVRIDTHDDRVMQHDLKAEPYFIEALRYGVESFEGNGVAPDAFERICANSAEVGAADHATSAGEDVRQARVLELVWRSQRTGAEWEAIGAKVSPDRPGL